MASPPFSINETLPGDSDIVSQHPTNARAFRDVVESWLLVNHDTNGKHARVDVAQQASPTTPSSGYDVIYSTTTGHLKVKHSDGTEEFVGLPPGTVLYTGGALPTGFLEADGSAVSRSTFADLFSSIDVTFGAGNGSTTFNLPDIKGRVIAGKEASATRLTSTYFGGTSTSIGAVGGLESHTLTEAQLAAHTHTASVTDPGHTHTYDKASSGQQKPNGTGTTPFEDSVNTTTGSSTTGITVSNASTGGGGAHNNVQPTIILRAIIKY